jgi:hypothetical protein
MSDTIQKKSKCKFLREKKKTLSRKLRRLDHSIGKCADLLNIDYMLEKRESLNLEIQVLGRRGV